MTKTHFEVLISFDILDEDACSQEACDGFLDNFLMTMTKKLGGRKDFAELREIIIKAGPEDSPRPFYKADIRDYSNKKHFS